MDYDGLNDALVVFHKEEKEMNGVKQFPGMSYGTFYSKATVGYILDRLHEIETKYAHLDESRLI